MSSNQEARFKANGAWYPFPVQPVYSVNWKFIKTEARYDVCVSPWGECFPSEICSNCGCMVVGAVYSRSLYPGLIAGSKAREYTCNYTCRCNYIRAYSIYSEHGFLGRDYD